MYINPTDGNETIDSPNSKIKTINQQIPSLSQLIRVNLKEINNGAYFFDSKLKYRGFAPYTHFVKI